jgi:hypothetical protein
VSFSSQPESITTDVFILHIGNSLIAVWFYARIRSGWPAVLNRDRYLMDAQECKHPYLAQIYLLSQTFTHEPVEVGLYERPGLLGYLHCQ